MVNYSSATISLNWTGVNGWDSNWILSMDECVDSFRDGTIFWTLEAAVTIGRWKELTNSEVRGRWHHTKAFPVSWGCRSDFWMRLGRSTWHECFIVTREVGSCAGLPPRNRHIIVIFGTAHRALQNCTCTKTRELGETWRSARCLLTKSNISDTSFDTADWRKLCIQRRRPKAYRKPWQLWSSNRSSAFQTVSDDLSPTLCSMVVLWSENCCKNESHRARQKWSLPGLIA